MAADVQRSGGDGVGRGGVEMCLVETRSVPLTTPGSYLIHVYTYIIYHICFKKKLYMYIFLISIYIYIDII